MGDAIDDNVNDILSKIEQFRDADKQTAHDYLVDLVLLSQGRFQAPARLYDGTIGELRDDFYTCWTRDQFRDVLAKLEKRKGLGGLIRAAKQEIYDIIEHDKDAEIETKATEILTMFQHYQGPTAVQYMSDLVRLSEGQTDEMSSACEHSLGDVLDQDYKEWTPNNFRDLLDRLETQSTYLRNIIENIKPE